MIIKLKKKIICPCCMELHERQKCKTIEHTVINCIEVAYNAEYEYCPVADEYYSTEQELRKNTKNAMKAYKDKIKNMEK